MSSTAGAGSPASTGPSIEEQLGTEELRAQQGITLVAFLTALATSLVIFGIQIGLFLLLRNRLARIL